ncbi:hypothetical protein QJQ45_015773 [Haematococcus lacustris]|nr:hypothetical protein QJQ45_015773 [Haematococcus lacustris]
MTITTVPYDKDSGIHPKPYLVTLIQTSRYRLLRSGTCGCCSAARADVVMQMAAGPLVMLALARDNKVEEIERLVASGVPVDSSNQMGQTALHIAALWGNLEAAAALLRLGTPANIRNTRGSTPLHFAASAKRNCREMCELLLQHGAHTDDLTATAPDAARDCSLRVALLLQHVDMAGRVPYEMAASDDLRALLGGPDPRIFDYCEKGNANALAALLAGGAAAASRGVGQGAAAGKKLSVKVLDSEGHSPLNIAVAHEHLEVVKVLLKHDPSCLACPDLQGHTALHCAAGAGNLDVLKLLLAQRHSSALINTQSLNPSEYASGNWLLEGEEVEPLDRTPLSIAVELADLPVIRLLLEHGARLDIANFDGRMPLHLAVEEGEVEVAAALLEAGADPNAPCQDLVTCLHHAATKGPLPLLELLLRHKANPAATSNEGWAPLHLAARSGKTDRVALLLEAGADLTAVNAQGNRALHLAAVNNHLATVKLLCEKGADVRAKNLAGLAAVDMAKQGSEVKAYLQGRAPALD